MNLLVVEDDPVIAAQICQGLQSDCHQTTIAATGTDAIAEIRAREFDAVVLDRMLPDISGVDILAMLRSHSASTPVIFLSALGSVNDRIEGLRAGADDYLAKPFSIGELCARIDAIARRKPRSEDSGTLVVGRLVLDPSGHCAHFAGAAIELNRKQFSLLAHLMLNADKLVTRRMLLDQVWGYSFEPATNIVESNMSRLRARLQALGCDAIRTRRGLGYELHSTFCD